MKASNVKAVVTMSEFFAYNVDPEEFRDILHRASTLEETTRDREIMKMLSEDLAKALA